MAQHKDQKFVDRICHFPINRELLEVLRIHAHYRKTKVATCALLSESTDAIDLSPDDKKLAAALLAQRLLKIRDDSSFRLQHLMLGGEWEQKLIELASTHKSDEPHQQ